MKKFLFLVAFVCLGQMSFAQDSFKDDVMKLMAINGSAQSLELARTQVLPMISESKRAEFNKEFDATIPLFYTKLASVYMEVYSHDEIKELIEFYQTPIGKKTAENMGVISQKGMQAGQEWGMELQKIMVKFAQ